MSRGGNRYDYGGTHKNLQRGGGNKEDVCSKHLALVSHVIAYLLPRCRTYHTVRRRVAGAGGPAARVYLHVDRHTQNLIRTIRKIKSTCNHNSNSTILSRPEKDVSWILLLAAQQDIPRQHATPSRASCSTENAGQQTFGGIYANTHVCVRGQVQ